MNFSIAGNRVNFFVWTLLLLIALITFFPLSQIGFSNSDDMCYFLNSVGDIQKMSTNFAAYQGRFWIAISGWASYFPYFVHSRIWFLSALLVPLVASFALFVWLIYRWSHNHLITVITALFLCASFQITGGFSATAGFPFVFAFSFSLILIAFHFVLSYLQTQRFFWIILSSIVFAWATTFYETFLLYYIIVYLLLRTDYPTCFWKQKNLFLKFCKELLPFFIFAVAYVIVYLVYASMHHSQYVGNSITDISFSKFIKSLNDFWINSFPLSAFHQYRSFFADYSTDLNFTDSFWYILFHAGIVAWIKGILVVAIFYYVVKVQNFTFEFRKLWYFFAIAVIASVLSHFLLCLTPKYTAYHLHFYVTSLFAFFDISLAIVLLYLIVSKVVSSKPWLYTLFNFLIGVGLLLITVLTQFSNEQVTNDLHRSQLRYSGIDGFVSHEKVNINLPIWIGQYQLSPSYFGYDISKLACNNVAYYIGCTWPQWINYDLDYSVFYNKYKSSNQDVAILTYAQAAQNDDLYMMYFICKGSELTEDPINLKSNRLIVGYYSATHAFSFSVLGNPTSKVYINKNQNVTARKDCFYANCCFMSNKPLKILDVQGTQLLPSSVCISNILFSYIKPIQFDIDQQYLLIPQKHIRFSKTNYLRISSLYPEGNDSVK